MKNLKFTFNELVRKPFSGIIIIAQIALSVSILTQGLTNMFSAIDNLKQTEKILKNNNVYSLESADLDNEIENMEGKDNEYKKFYKYLHNTYKKNMICSMGASFLIKNFTSDSKFYSNKDEKYVINPEGIEGTYSQVQSCYIDKNFYNAFPFSTISGRGFKNSDFNQKNVIPVILGYEYKGIYKVGDTFNIYDCYFSKKVKKIKIIGILKKNSYCLSNGTSLNNLDNEILSPIGYMDKSNINANCYMNYLNSSFIITNNKDKASEKIEEKISKLELFDYQLSSCKSGVMIDISDKKSLAKSSLSLSICILLMTSIAVTIIQVNRIKEMMVETGVHLLSGATKKDICLRNIYSVAIYLFSGIIIGSIYGFKFANTIYDYSSIDIRIIIVLILFYVVLVSLISFLPYMKIKKMEISHIIRGISK